MHFYSKVVFASKRISKQSCNTFFQYLFNRFFLRATMAFSTELWGDESISVEIATKTSFSSLITQSIEYWDVVHPSGYYLLLKVWIAIGFFNDDWIRSLSLFFFLPTLAGMYKLARLFNLDHKVALLSMLIFSIHPDPLPL